LILSEDWMLYENGCIPKFVRKLKAEDSKNSGE